MPKKTKVSRSNAFVEIGLENGLDNLHDWARDERIKLLVARDAKFYLSMFRGAPYFTIRVLSKGRYGFLFALAGMRKIRALCKMLNETTTKVDRRNAKRRVQKKRPRTGTRKG